MLALSPGLLTLHGTGHISRRAMVSAPNPIADIQSLVERTLVLAVANLHLSACFLKPERFVKTTDKERLVTHIEKMADFIARHASADFMRLIDCPYCRRAVLDKLGAASTVH